MIDWTQVRSARDAASLGPPAQTRRHGPVSIPPHRRRSCLPFMSGSRAAPGAPLLSRAADSGSAFRAGGGVTAPAALVVVRLQRLGGRSRAELMLQHTPLLLWSCLFMHSQVPNRPADKGQLQAADIG